MGHKFNLLSRLRKISLEYVGEGEDANAEGHVGPEHQPGQNLQVGPEH